ISDSCNDTKLSGGGCMTYNGRSSRPLFQKSVLALSIGAALTTLPAYAQNDIEEISVTGSRIRMTSGMSTPTPVTVVTRDELSSFNPGASTVEQMAQLPQFF